MYAEGKHIPRPGARSLRPPTAQVTALFHPDPGRAQAYSADRAYRGGATL
jgi:hypothetical protein